MTGYTDVSCSGDGNTDLVLSNMSKQVGSKLVRVKISSSSSVTDVGLHSLLCKTMVVEVSRLFTCTFGIKTSTGFPSAAFALGGPAEGRVWIVSPRRL